MTDLAVPAPSAAVDAPALRPATKLVLWGYAAAAGTALFATLLRAQTPTGIGLLLALAIVGLLALAWLFPLPVGFKTKFYLDSSAVLAAVLIFEPGIATVIVGTGVLLGNLARRVSGDEMLFNLSQYVVQAAIGSSILAAAGWHESDLEAITLPRLCLIALAAIAMYVVNVLSVGLVVGIEANLPPREFWRRSWMNLDRTDHMTHGAQGAVGLLAAALAHELPWALPLLLLPMLAVYSTMANVSRLKERVSAALQGSEGTLAAAQRIARLGSWEWDLATGDHLWSDEAYRVVGVAKRDFLPTHRAFLTVVDADDRPAVEEALQDAVDHGLPYSLDVRLADAGNPRLVHVQGEVMRDEAGRAVRMVGTIHDITERKALEDRLTFHAFHDPLTGLPNRAFLLDRLGQALARAAGQPGAVALLFIDLDRFKEINDRHGHDAGDRVLVEAARRMRRCVRPHDTVARLAGDEFTVLLEDIPNRELSAKIARRLTAALAAPIRLGDQAVAVTASVGIALNPAAADAADLLRAADAAMYRAKSAGRGLTALPPITPDPTLPGAKLAATPTAPRLVEGAHGIESTGDLRPAPTSAPFGIVPLSGIARR